tara:strand:- start:210 stop:641 length:432 start_codon:yes stop_codon:yes gene_type:complete
MEKGGVSKEWMKILMKWERVRRQFHQQNFASNQAHRQTFRDMPIGWVARSERPGHWIIQKEGEPFLVKASDVDNQKIYVEIMSLDLLTVLHVELIEVGHRESWWEAMVRVWGAVLRAGLRSSRLRFVPNTGLEPGEDNGGVGE